MPKKSSEKQTASSSGPVKDARFANFESNPRFKLPSKKHNKTVLDKRFSRMLKDEDFIATAKVDRYGRKLKSDNKKKALKRIYRAEDDDEDDEDGKEAEVEDDDVVQRELQKADTKIDPARGGGFLESESESESESDSDEEEVGEEQVEAEVDNSASMQRLRDAQADVETGEVTKRIAIVNLDWDHIKSNDLMALFSSFAPKGGRIERVSIYPSEFGKGRMQREELEGPPREIFKKEGQSKEDESEPDSEDDSDEDNDEDEDDDEKIKKEIIKEGDEDDFDSDALRAYQLDRLRYYYAVMVCSDTSTAQKIYDATDGTEYQASSNFIDLRFIPDDVTFDDEPRDECDQIGVDYKPTEFITDALQHSKVKLTWDMHPEELARKEEIKRAFSGSRAELEENDMRAYLASDSEDEDGSAEEEEDAVAEENQPKLSKKELKAQKMRELLGLGAEPLAKPSKSGPVGDMQITFTPALMGGEKKKKEPGAEETTLEKYKRKERERKAKKKEMVIAKRNGLDPDAGAVEEEEGGELAANEDGEDGDGDGDGDLGFDDPFFTADEPTAKKGPKGSERKEERLRRREAKAAEAAAAAAERAQLEAIMEDGTRDAEAGRLGHFDINEIRKAEKLKAKKLLKKKIKGKKGKEDQGAALQEGFKVDVADDRFSKLFQDEKFAIDPSHPHFKATEGMKSILEEGRKKRKLGEDDEVVDREQQQRTKQKGAKDKKSKKQKVTEPPNDDLATLVESVRRKAKSKSKRKDD